MANTVPAALAASPGSFGTPSCPDLYDAAYYFGRRLSCRYLVAIGIGDFAELERLGKTFQTVILDSPDRLQAFGKLCPSTGSRPLRRSPLLGPLLEDKGREFPPRYPSA